MAKKSRNAIAMDSPGEYKPPEDRKSGPFSEYDVQNAIDTLIKANRIKKNRKLLAACAAKAKEQQQQLTKATAR